MKLPNHTVAVILLFFVVETQCGVIDNIFDKVKNTSNALKQDVKNVFTYSKEVIGIKTPVDSRPEEEKRGLIGGMIHSTGEKMHNIREYFWKTDTNTKDAGIIGNMYNRVKNRISKLKGSLLGEDQTPRPPSENEKLIQKTLDKLFFGNGTRQIYGKPFQEAIEKLRKELHEIKESVKNGTETPVHHGEGLIDVRAIAINSENVKDNAAGVANDVYDAVQENLNKTKEDATKSYNSIKNDTDKAVSELINEVNNTADQLNVIRDTAFDTAARENELFQSSYNNISGNAQKLGRAVKNEVEDAKRF